MLVCKHVCKATTTRKMNKGMATDIDEDNGDVGSQLDKEASRLTFGRREDPSRVAGMANNTNAEDEI